MMAVDQFCLKWNNFPTSIVTAFGSLQTTEDLADVTLTCEGVSIKAHKIILSACSPYFRTVFKDNPCHHPIVILKDVLHADLLAVLNFMYHGEVLISHDKLASFLQTAEILQVSGLVGNMDLPVKLTAGTIKSCSKPLKPKSTEFMETSQKRLKTTKSKAKTSPAPAIVKTPENTISSPISKENLQRDSICEERFETVAVDSIKTEIIEDVHGDHNFNDKIDAYDIADKTKLQGSILEAALEVKEMQPSILERSLTSHASKSPSMMSYALDNVTVVQESSPEPPEAIYVPRKSDLLETEKRGLKHKLSETSIQQCKTFDLIPEPLQQKYPKFDIDCLKNAEISIQGLPSDISVVNVRGIQDMQPHHSSQCGNCPHCGKVYSNQSALKYHVRLVHSDLTNMYCCHLCPESFDYREGYKKHMVEAHSIRN